MEQKHAEFIGTCVGLPGYWLEKYDDSERTITYATFVKHVGAEVLRELRFQFGYARSKRGGLTLRDDWAVSYGKGLWKGKPAVCMHHSSIHHLWILTK